jgi:hypothetical protein
MPTIAAKMYDRFTTLFLGHHLQVEHVLANLAKLHPFLFRFKKLWCPFFLTFENVFYYLFVHARQYELSVTFKCFSIEKRQPNGCSVL